MISIISPKYVLHSSDNEGCKSLKTSSLQTAILSTKFQSILNMASANHLSISTHVLDTTVGRPAADVPITLEHRDANGEWHLLAQRKTDADGRVRDLLPESHAHTLGVYRFRFDTSARSSFFPEVVVFCNIDAAQHYHIPLLLSAYSYSTYRGS